VATVEIGNSSPLSLTTKVVTAFVRKNSLPSAEILPLIASVHSALTRLATAAVEPEAPVALTPAVPVRNSVTPDYLICLDSGKKFQALKRHLHTLGMTPQQYREKWGLPADYPMVAPSYSARRAEIARQTDLGHRGRKANQVNSRRTRPTNTRALRA
jgi:predicted transcriptional regulator